MKCPICKDKQIIDPRLRKQIELTGFPFPKIGYCNHKFKDLVDRINILEKARHSEFVMPDFSKWLDLENKKVDENGL